MPQPLLYAGIPEKNVISLSNGVKLPYTYGTALTLSIPAHIISDLLKKELYDRKTNKVDVRDTSNHPTLEELFATQEIKVREPKKATPGVEAVADTDLDFPGK